MDVLESGEIPPSFRGPRLAVLSAMNDVQFNTMLMATSDRALARRRGEALAEASDFETILAAVPPSAAPAAETTATEPVVSEPNVASADKVATLTGDQMDALMANFGQGSATASAPDPAERAEPAKPAKDSSAVAALKASPAAANLTPDQLKALLAGFGRDASTDVVEMADTSQPAPAATPASISTADTMSATNFFPITRNANGRPSLYASVDPTTDKATPAAARYFASPPNDNSYSSLYGATPPDSAPAAPKASTPKAEAAPAMVASTADPGARYFPINDSHADPTANITARDSYLRAMDMNARMLGLPTSR